MKSKFIAKFIAADRGDVATYGAAAPGAIDIRQLSADFNVMCVFS